MCPCHESQQKLGRGFSSPSPVSPSYQCPPHTSVPSHSPVSPHTSVPPSLPASWTLSLQALLYFVPFPCNTYFSPVQLSPQFNCLPELFTYLIPQKASLGRKSLLWFIVQVDAVQDREGAPQAAGHLTSTGSRRKQCVLGLSEASLPIQSKPRPWNAAALPQGQSPHRS